MIPKYLAVLLYFLLFFAFLKPISIFANTYYFQEEFNETRTPNTLDLSKWNIYPNALGSITTIQETGGNLHMSQQNNTHQFPLIVSKDAFPEGDFSIDIKFQYNQVVGGGTGFALSEVAPINGGGFLNVFTISMWQDTMPYKMRIGYGDGMSADRIVYQTTSTDINEHVFRVQYNSQKYFIYLDGRLVYTSQNTSKKIKYLWFGNPDYLNPVVPSWSSSKIDYVRVTALPQPFLDLPWDYSGKGLSFNEAALAINSFFDHQYPLLSRGLDLPEPATTSATIVNFLGETWDSNKKPYSKHDGYDYGILAKARLNDPVLAAAFGSATYINSCSSCGNMVVIDHGNGYQTRYMHLQKDGLITDIPNQPVPVSNRQQIGRVGWSGNVWPNNESGAHIHFGVFQDRNGDGNFNDNEPDGVTDPFGWQSNTTDPWPNYIFNYTGQNRTGNKSYYLWKNNLANMASTITPAGSTLNIGNYTLNFPPNSTNKNIVINAKSAPVVQPSNILTSLGSTLLVNANDTVGNPVTNLQNPFNIFLDFSSLDGSRIKNNTLSFYSSPDGINWTKENTTFLNGTTAQALINHLSYFALIGERKDTTPPTTIAVLTGANGQPSWFRSDVQLTLNAEDDNLGVYYTVYKVNDEEMKIYESPLNFTSEGHYKIDFYSVDNDDNTEETKSVEFDIDKTPPQITINTPADKAVYTLNQPMAADWSVSDSLSGIDNAATNATTPSGSPLDTNTAGTHSFTVSTKDLAGNESNKTASYSVHYNYDGFLPPLYDKDFKKGRTIPVKFQLTDSTGVYIGTAEAHLFVDNNPAESSGNSNTGDLFRYDPISNQYIYNLSTSALTTGAHTLKVKLDDGTEYSTDIIIR